MFHKSKCSSGRWADTAAAVLPKQTMVSMWSPQKTFYKTFRTPWCPTLSAEMHHFLMFLSCLILIWFCHFSRGLTDDSKVTSPMVWVGFPESSRAFLWAGIPWGGSNFVWVQSTCFLQRRRRPTLLRISSFKYLGQSEVPESVSLVIENVTT